jgi:hypothetical protein
MCIQCDICTIQLESYHTKHMLDLLERLVTQQKELIDMSKMIGPDNEDMKYMYNAKYDDYIRTFNMFQELKRQTENIRVNPSS